MVIVTVAFSANTHRARRRRLRFFTVCTSLTRDTRADMRNLHSVALLLHVRTVHVRGDSAVDCMHPHAPMHAPPPPHPPPHPGSCHGRDPMAADGAHKELQRLKQYGEKLRRAVGKAEAAASRPSLTLDVAAASRFIDHAIAGDLSKVRRAGLASQDGASPVLGRGVSHGAPRMPYASP